MKILLVAFFAVLSRNKVSLSYTESDGGVELPPNRYLYIYSVQTWSTQEWYEWYRIHQHMERLGVDPYFPERNTEDGGTDNENAAPARFGKVADVGGSEA